MIELTQQGSEVSSQRGPINIIRNIGHAGILAGAIAETWTLEVIPVDRGREKAGALILLGACLLEWLNWPAKSARRPTE